MTLQTKGVLYTTLALFVLRVSGFSVVILPLPRDNGGTRKSLWKRKDLRTEGTDCFELLLPIEILI
jgi:hypothetical protein